MSLLCNYIWTTTEVSKYQYTRSSAQITFIRFMFCCGFFFQKNERTARLRQYLLWFFAIATIATTSTRRRIPATTMRTMTGRLNSSTAVFFSSSSLWRNRDAISAELASTSLGIGCNNTASQNNEKYNKQEGLVYCCFHNVFSHNQKQWWQPQIYVYSRKILAIARIAESVSMGVQ